ncbi:MAG: alpha/beta hydrolase [Nitrospinota bacterium]
MGCPGVVLCHGMLSHKESAKLIRFSQELARAGMWALRFDFSFLGESDGTLFEMTYEQEVEDLAAAVAFLRSRAGGRLGLMGSSMGGTVALLCAARPGGVDALATLNAVAYPGRFPRGGVAEEGELERWRRQGYIDTPLGPIGLGFFESCARQDVVGAARRLRCPSLFIHGDSDEVVDASEARDLYAAAPPEPKELLILPGADHRLTQPDDVERVARSLRAFFARCLMPV